MCVSRSGIYTIDSALKCNGESVSKQEHLKTALREVESTETREVSHRWANGFSGMKVELWGVFIECIGTILKRWDLMKWVKSELQCLSWVRSWAEGRTVHPQKPPKVEGMAGWRCGLTAAHLGLGHNQDKAHKFVRAELRHFPYLLSLMQPREKTLFFLLCLLSFS